MEEEKFIAEIAGDGFTLTMQGSGDMESAKATLSVAFGGCTVAVRSFGEPVDIESGS